MACRLEKTPAQRPGMYLACTGLLALALTSCGNGSDDTSPGGATPYVERIFLRDKLDTPVVTGMDMGEAAREYVRSQYQSIGGLTDDTSFVAQSVSVGMDGLHHARLAQTYRDVRVFGADVVVHASDTAFRSVNGTIIKALAGFDVSASVSADAAANTSRADYATLAKEEVELAFEREASELVIYPVDDRTVKLAWHVSFFTEAQAGIAPGLWHYFIDARTGELLARHNGIHAAVVQASGPGGNDKVARTWTDVLDVEDLGGGRGRMQTATLVTRDLQGATEGEGVVVEGDIAAFGDAAVNDAHAFAEITLQMMQEWFGIDSLDGNGLVVESRVHYGTGIENAFWDGVRVTYGDGGASFYPLSGALDVVAHELHHGLIDHHARLLYAGQSAAVRESFADIAGTVAEFYWKGASADWDIGRDIMRTEGVIRYLCDPSQDGASIDHASKYAADLEPHHAAGVMNRAFCRIARRLGSDSPDGEATPESVQRAGEAFYLAGTSYFAASTNFYQACQGVLEAATALGFSAEEQQAIILSWQDVGVVCGETARPPQCDQQLTADAGEIASPNHPNDYPNSLRYTWCIQPASGQPATLTFTSLDTEKDYDVVEIKGPSGMVLGRASGTTLPEPVDSAFIAVTFVSDGSVTGKGFSAEWTTGNVQNKPPLVVLTVPDPGETVTGLVTIAAIVSDQDGTVTQVTFDLPDGTQVPFTTEPYSLRWDSTSVFDGPATIRATAVDNLGTQSTAEVAFTVANGNVCAPGTFTATDVPVSIPDADNTGITSTITIGAQGRVQDLSLSLNIEHTWRSDLVVTLESPGGTLFTVYDSQLSDSEDNIVINGLALPAFDGQSMMGAWRLRVRDEIFDDTGRLVSWSLTSACQGELWYAAATPNAAIPNNDGVCTSVTVTDPGDASQAKLDIEGTHDYRPSLRGTLAHGGVVVTAFPTGTLPAYGGAFEFTDRPVPGLSGDARGEWTFCIYDTDMPSDNGVLSSWAVHN